MKISFNVDDVISQLAGVSSVVNQKNVVPALDNFLCVAVKDKKALRVVASDNETWVGCSLQLECLEVEDGKESFCVNAKDFVSALKNLSGKKVEADIEQKEKVIVCNHGSGRFKLPLSDAEMYPLPVNVTEPSVDVVLDAHAVADMIAKTRNFVGNMVTYPQFGGIHFDFADNSVTVVAADGFRLVRTRSMYDKLNGQVGGFTMPQKAASIIMSIMQSLDDGDYVRVISNGSNVSFMAGTWRMTTRLIETAYPLYERLLVSDGYFNVQVDTKELCMSVKRVLGLGNKISELVVLTIEKDSIGLVAENVVYSTSAEEHVQCKSEINDGESFRIGLNGGALMQMLQNLTTDTAVIKFITPERAAMFFNNDDNDGVMYAGLLLPMQFNQ